MTQARLLIVRSFEHDLVLPLSLRWLFNSTALVSSKRRLACLLIVIILQARREFQHQPAGKFFMLDRIGYFSFRCRESVSY